MGWDAKFHRPIELACGKTIRTLSDARDYVLKLPRAEQQKSHWETAVGALMLEGQQAGNHSMFSEMAMRSALAGGQSMERPELKPNAKSTHWGRRNLARDK